MHWYCGETYRWSHWVTSRSRDSFREIQSRPGSDVVRMPKMFFVNWSYSSSTVSIHLLGINDVDGRIIIAWLTYSIVSLVKNCLIQIPDLQALLKIDIQILILKWLYKAHQLSYEPAMKTFVIIAGKNSIESADVIMSSRLIRTMDTSIGRRRVSSSHTLV